MTAFLRSIDENARKRFQTDLGGYAGISAIHELTYAPPLNKRISDFRNGKRGPRDSVRAAVHFEASQLKNAESRVMAFHLAVEAAGHDGTCAPEDVLASGVVATTGGLCAPRTYRAALRGLVLKGWLSKTKVPTGTRVVTGEDAAGNPLWKSLKVNKTRLTRSARLLLSKNSPTLHTSNDTTLPRQKAPLTVGDKRELSLSERKLSHCRSTHEFETPRASRRDSSKESPKGDRSTSPGRSAPTGKHRASRTASRKTASKGAVVNSSARKSRNRAFSTWDSARATLLRDLFAFLKSHPNRDLIYHTVKLQTDRAYPTACLSATNWEKWIWRWPEMSYHDARRAVKNQLMPLLEAFCADLIPPDTTPLKRPDLPEPMRKQILAELESHKRLSEWMQVIPAAIPVDIPKSHRERLETERWRLNRIIYAIHTGKMSLSDLSKEDHDVLHIAAQSRGVAE